MLAKVDHLSYSSIERYLLCPRSWWFRYVKRVPGLTSPAMALGTAMHRAVEQMLRLRYEEDEEPEQEAVWARAWAAATEQDIDWEDKPAEQVDNDGFRLFASAAAQTAIARLVPRMDGDGLYIERLVTLRVPLVPAPIIGYVDLITAEGIPVDLKTSSRAWTENRAQRELQPLFYLAALNQQGYTANPGYWFRHLVFVTAGEPQVQMIASKRDPHELLWLCGLIQEVWQAIASDAFPPNPTCWKCSERSCEYWNMCRGKR